MTPSLPPGFRFHPNDEELVGYYLTRRATNSPIEYDVIPEQDLYKCEPWDLPSKSRLPAMDPEWYFFTPRDRKYPNGARNNRATLAGYWKATGRDREVKSRSKVIGMKKTLVFYRGRAPDGARTDWLMHEYRLVGDNWERTPKTRTMRDFYVLCRVIKKNGFNDLTKLSRESMPRGTEFGQDDSYGETEASSGAISDISQNEEKPRILQISSSEAVTPGTTQQQQLLMESCLLPLKNCVSSPAEDSLPRFHPSVEELGVVKHDIYETASTMSLMSPCETFSLWPSALTPESVGQGAPESKESGTLWSSALALDSEGQGAPEVDGSLTGSLRPFEDNSLLSKVLGDGFLGNPTQTTGDTLTGFNFDAFLNDYNDRDIIDFPTPAPHFDDFDLPPLKDLSPNDWPVDEVIDVPSPNIQIRHRQEPLATLSNPNWAWTANSRMLCQRRSSSTEKIPDSKHELPAKDSTSGVDNEDNGDSLICAPALEMSQGQENGSSVVPSLPADVIEEPLLSSNGVCVDSLSVEAETCSHPATNSLTPELSQQPEEKFDQSRLDCSCSVVGQSSGKDERQYSSCSHTLPNNHDEKLSISMSRQDKPPTYLQGLLQLIVQPIITTAAGYSTSDMQQAKIQGSSASIASMRVNLVAITCSCDKGASKARLRATIFNCYCNNGTQQMCNSEKSQSATLPVNLGATPITREYGEKGDSKGSISALGIAKGRECNCVPGVNIWKLFGALILFMVLSACMAYFSLDTVCKPMQNHVG